MSYRRYYGINRTMCDVLEEMRTCSKTKNYGYLDSLISEAQHLANRMESALYDIKDFRQMKEDMDKLKKKLKKKGK